MWTIIWVVLAVLAIRGWQSWRKRRSRASPMISLVALLRKPVTLDPAVVAKAASRVWDIDLGDGNSEGKDGMVVGEAPGFILHGDRRYLVHSFANPYTDDPETASESIPDLRLRRLFSEHRAWFSFDALWVDEKTSADEITDCYRRLGKLFAEFLDANCLLIFVPETSRAYSVNDETERALQSDDPLRALEETLPVPVTQIADDDPLMKDAVAQARTNWPQFVAAFEERNGNTFSVKGPVRHSGNTEFIWLTVRAVEGDRIYGELANDPADLGPLKLGSKVTVSLEDLNDWCYIDGDGQMQGGFTIAAVAAAARRQQNK